MTSLLVRAILFLAPLSAFNQTLEEQPTVNRVEDSLLLWRGRWLIVVIICSI
jgi:hypothetical protein